ncbi:MULTISPECIES: OmpW/AlkL family protein [Phenylobacterium]|uniref:Outer membrane protein n=1 Tax=Phenylobacterium koreense TaxID=266125 RepID=A0ABV2EF61_9CAUL
MKTKFLAAAAATLALGAPALASAQSAPAKGDLLVTLRATSVSSSADDAITTAAGAATGLNVDVGSDVMPTLGFTYFLTDKLAVEAILGMTQHEIRAKGPGTDVEVHETWVLPPVVTLQYRPLSSGSFSPYVGAGVNAMVFNGKDKNGFEVDLDNSLGLALQAGADVALNEQWFLNADVKKVFVKTDAKINGGALKSEVQLDPWVVSIGLGRRF